MSGTGSTGALLLLEVLVILLNALLAGGLTLYGLSVLLLLDGQT
jgi:hypothetical protein